ncbi:MAG: hypothetical protein V1927_03455 [Candidatus Omnitrophota bacterium]
MAKKIRMNKKHRICRTTGCKHILSVYNTENHCHVHQQLTMMQQTPSMALIKR